MLIIKPNGDKQKKLEALIKALIKSVSLITISAKRFEPLMKFTSRLKPKSRIIRTRQKHVK